MTENFSWASCLLEFRKRKIDGDTVDGEGPSGTKKIKKEEKDVQQTEEIKKQNKILFKYRDQLESLSKQELQILLESNDQQIPSGVSEVHLFIEFFFNKLHLRICFQLFIAIFIDIGPPCWCYDIWCLNSMQWM